MHAVTQRSLYVIGRVDEFGFYHTYGHQHLSFFFYVGACPADSLKFNYLNSLGFIKFTPYTVEKCDCLDYSNTWAIHNNPSHGTFFFVRLSLSTQFSIIAVHFSLESSFLKLDGSHLTFIMGLQWQRNTIGRKQEMP